MKNLGLYCLLLACIGFESCKKNQSKDELKKPNVQFEKPINVQCYEALYEQDTIKLTINTMKNEKITGDLVMSLANMPKKIGEITGEYSGDTLFVAYTFIEESNNKITYKNPMAFLKKDNLLILGNGQIITSMGASFFDKNTPIDFENVKYKFENVDCIGK